MCPAEAVALFFVLLTLFNARFFSNIVVFVYHFFAQLSIGWKGRKVAIYCHIRQYKLCLHGQCFAMKFYSVRKYFLNSCFSYTPAKMYKITRIAGKFMLEKQAATKILKVRIAFLRKRYLFVARTVQVFEHQNANHQPDRHCRTARLL
jgi:hypothetical protein